jgi:hypothetical protein
MLWWIFLCLTETIASTLHHDVLALKTKAKEYQQK